MTQTPSIARLLLLPVLAFGIAVIVHIALAAAGVSSSNPLRLFATPLIGAVVVYFGLWGYPRARRIRMAILVAAGLLLLGLLV
jgi:hypothetical protein